MFRCLAHPVVVVDALTEGLSQLLYIIHINLLLCLVKGESLSVSIRFGVSHILHEIPFYSSAVGIRDEIGVQRLFEVFIVEEYGILLDALCKQILQFIKRFVLNRLDISDGFFVILSNHVFVADAGHISQVERDTKFLEHDFQHLVFLTVDATGYGLFHGAQQGHEVGIVLQPPLHVLHI